MVGPRLALVLLAGFALVPGADADLQLAVSGQPDGPIDPVSAVAQLTLHITADCVDVLAAMDATEPTAPPTVTVDITAPPQAIVSGATVSTLSADPCRSGATNVTATQQHVVTLTREAPGLEPLSIRFEATLGQAVGDALVAEASADVTAAPFFHFGATVSQKMKEAVDGRAAFDITVTNFGNTAAQIGWEFVDGAAVLLEVSPVTLDPPWGAQPSGTSTIILGPGASGGESAITLRAIARLAGSSDAGNASSTPITVTLLVRHEASFLEKTTPAPPVLPLLLACVAVAVALRRRA